MSLANLHNSPMDINRGGWRICILAQIMLYFKSKIEYKPLGVLKG